MGYDDNTPLNDVTGGGLPAEIWRETMVRVHDGVPVRPLPIVPPAPKAAPQPQPQQQRGRDPVQDVAETVLEQVLRDLFGGGNR